MRTDLNGVDIKRLEQCITPDLKAGTQGKSGVEYLGRVFSNIAKVITSKFHRLELLISGGKWVTNKDISNEGTKKLLGLEKGEIQKAMVTIGDACKKITQEIADPSKQNIEELLKMKKVILTMDGVCQRMMKFGVDPGNLRSEIQNLDREMDDLVKLARQASTDAFIKGKAVDQKEELRKLKKPETFAEGLGALPKKRDEILAEKQKKIDANLKKFNAGVEGKHVDLKPAGKRSKDLEFGGEPKTPLEHIKMEARHNKLMQQKGVEESWETKVDDEMNDLDSLVDKIAAEPAEYLSKKNYKTYEALHLLIGNIKTREDYSPEENEVITKLEFVSDKAFERVAHETLSMLRARMLTDKVATLNDKGGLVFNEKNKETETLYNAVESLID